MKAVKGPSYRGPLYEGFHLLFSEASLAPPSAVRALVNLARYLTDVGFGCSFGFGVLGFSSPPCFAIHAFGVEVRTTPPTCRAPPWPSGSYHLLRALSLPLVSREWRNGVQL